MTAPTPIDAETVERVARGICCNNKCPYPIEQCASFAGSTGDGPRQQARDAIAALQALGWRPPIQWQPIETAPTDGTVILVYRRDQGRFCAHYVAPADIIDSDDCKPQWFSTHGDSLDASNGTMPTHWQPLPAPPETEPPS